MPDVSYVITIKNETGDGVPGASTKNIVTPTPNNDKKEKKEKGGLIQGEEGRKAFIKGVAIYGTVKSFATQIISHEIATVELRTGSSEAQQIASAWYNGINRGVGVLEKVGTGAALGGGAGAAVGLAIGVMHEAVSISQNIIDIALNAALENTSIRLNYIRAGVNGSRQI